MVRESWSIIPLISSTEKYFLPQSRWKIRMNSSPAAVAAVLPSAALTLIPQPRKGRAETTVSADRSSAVSRLVSFLFMVYCLPFLSDPEVTRVATCGYVLGVSTG